MTITREMAHFIAYSTTDANNPSPIVKAGQSIPVMTLEAATEGLIVGTLISDQAGTLTIAQSFDNENWDYTGTPIEITAGMGVGISEEVFAPYVQVSFENTSGTDQTYMRLFLHAVGKRTV